MLQTHALAATVGALVGFEMSVSRMPAKPREKRIIILGATSAIAQAAARLWAVNASHIVLVARNSERLNAVSDDLRSRGAQTYTVAMDLAEPGAEQEFGRLVKLIETVDVVLIAYGLLGDQNVAESDLAAAQRILAYNFTSAAAWCLAATNQLISQDAGALIAIGSLAGDRGRKKNYIYGAAKGGLGVLVEGIAHRLAGTGARAILVKPGFVDTPMTAGFHKRGLLRSSVDQVARDIVRSAESRHPVVYTPWFWRWIMIGVRHLPWAVFKRLDF